MERQRPFAIRAHGRDPSTKDYSESGDAGLLLHGSDPSNIQVEGIDAYFGYINNGLHINQIMETLPVVGTDQNAIGGTGTIVTYYDPHGRVERITDADGYSKSCFYDDPTGALTETVAVVNLSTNTTITTGAVPDLLGRPVQTTDGNLNVTNIAYVDGLLQSTVTTTPAAGPTQEVIDNTGQGTIATLATVPGGSLQAVSKVWLDYVGRILETQWYSGQSGGTYTTSDEYDFGNLCWTEAPSARSPRRTSTGSTAQPASASASTPIT